MLLERGLDAFHAGRNLNGTEFAGNGGCVLSSEKDIHWRKHKKASRRLVRTQNGNEFFYRHYIGWRIFE